MNLQEFDSTSLEELSKVALLKRVDTKFRFQSELLPSILDAVKSENKILELEQRRLSGYHTEYYDTQTNAMYLAHHNGKANRYKIRTRTYLDSNQHFVEVKLKNNKGITKKIRFVREQEHTSFSGDESRFIESQSPFESANLEHKMTSSFNRLTLVDYKRGERITIDLNLAFSSETRKLSLINVVVAEIKSSGRPSDSPFFQALRSQKIYPARFSKYCLGRALLEPNLKQNRFKERLLALQKISPKLTTV